MKLYPQKFESLLKNFLKNVINLDDLQNIVESAKGQYYDISSRYVHHRELTRMNDIKFSSEEEALRYKFITLITMFCESNI